mmetsp:Transcript_12400/g.30910  ORF Transcript_12400/g.30910 Transcript_12400/m.30910 type:complete len:277 (-) Transcript_12400:442-1272(-)
MAWTCRACPLVHVRSQSTQLQSHRHPRLHHHPRLRFPPNHRHRRLHHLRPHHRQQGRLLYLLHCLLPPHHLRPHHHHRHRHRRRPLQTCLHPFLRLLQGDIRPLLQDCLRHVHPQYDHLSLHHRHRHRRHFRHRASRHHGHHQSFRPVPALPRTLLCRLHHLSHRRPRHHSPHTSRRPCHHPRVYRLRRVHRRRHQHLLQSHRLAQAYSLSHLCHQVRPMIRCSMPAQSFPDPGRRLRGHHLLCFLLFRDRRLVHRRSPLVGSLVLETRIQLFGRR